MLGTASSHVLIVWCYEGGFHALLHHLFGFRSDCESFESLYVYVDDVDLSRD